MILLCRDRRLPRSAGEGVDKPASIPESHLHHHRIRILSMIDTRPTPSQSLKNYRGLFASMHVDSFYLSEWFDE
ncbi:hypothetical protein GCM10017767_22250 [Halomonas urumqiensis]|nr:hypothetical protein GCM10017767_22250 [Halomonas urumqiensis]